MNIPGVWLHWQGADAPGETCCWRLSLYGWAAILACALAAVLAVTIRDTQREETA